MEEPAMDALAERFEAGKVSPTVDKAARLQSFVEILPDGSPTTTTITIVAKRLRSHPDWRGTAGQRLNLDYIQKAVGKLIKAHPDLIGSEFKVSPRGRLELRIWRRQLEPGRPRDGAVP
jgi:hypothetical protein